MNQINNLILNQMKNQINQQKILFAISLIVFVVVLAAVVTANAAQYGTTISF